MGNVVHRETKEFRRSVNDPDFPILTWIHNPDLSAVDGFLSKYWVITGDTISLMDQAARDAVDAAEVVADIAADRIVEKGRIDVERILKALALVTKDEINILRAEHGLSARTNNQLLNAIKAKVDII